VYSTIYQQLTIKARPWLNPFSSYRPMTDKHRDNVRDHVRVDEQNAGS